MAQTLDFNNPRSLEQPYNPTQKYNPNQESFSALQAILSKNKGAQLEEDDNGNLYLLENNGRTRTPIQPGTRKYAQVRGILDKTLVNPTQQQQPTAITAKKQGGQINYLNLYE